MADKNKTSSNNNSGLPKRSMVVRVLILIVAVLMFVGAVAIPFFSSGIF